MREAHKRSRNPKVKKTYRVKNWRQCDKALRSRGDITIWFSDEATRAWTAKQTGKPGRQKKYSELVLSKYTNDLRSPLNNALRIPFGHRKSYRMMIFGKDGASACAEVKKLRINISKPELPPPPTETGGGGTHLGTHPEPSI